MTVSVNGNSRELASEGNCNHLIPEGEGQTVFKLEVEASDTVVLNAIVDQQMSKSVNESIVAPT